MKRPTAFAAALTFALIGAVSASAWAGPGHTGSDEQGLLGAPAPKGQGRVVRVVLSDNAFSVQHINVKAGETIRFMVSNRGQALHEFSFAAPEEQKKHRAEMAMMMEHGMITADKVVSLKMPMGNGQVMDHNDPNAVLLEPGKTAEISWRFTRPGTLELACNIPGHYESGMAGQIVVSSR